MTDKKSEGADMSAESYHLMCDSHHGVYIPQIMGTRLLEAGWSNIDADQVEVLNRGPDDEDYWEVWTRITDNAQFTDEQGREWGLHQDGDLWAYCAALMTDEDETNLFGAD